jgi:hypothetical protein
MQTLNAVPRRDLSFKEVSSNWGDYTILNCTGKPGHRKCTDYKSEFPDAQSALGFTVRCSRAQ